MVAVAVVVAAAAEVVVVVDMGRVVRAVVLAVVVMGLTTSKKTTVLLQKPNTSIHVYFSRERVTIRKERIIPIPDGALAYRMCWNKKAIIDDFFAFSFFVLCFRFSFAFLSFCYRVELQNAFA